MSDFRYTGSVSSLGSSFNQTVTITTDGVIKKDPSIPAAKVGSLTVRTDNTNGSLTFGAGHGFNTGDLMSIYWTDATTGLIMSRRRTSVTVAGNVVSFTGGLGDNLPPLNTANMAGSKPVVEDLVVTGSNVHAMVCQTPSPGTITFLLADGTTVVSEYYMPALNGDSRSWYLGSGVTNPFQGQAVAKISFTHNNPN